MAKKSETTKRNIRNKKVPSGDSSKNKEMKNTSIPLYPFKSKLPLALYDSFKGGGTIGDPDKDGKFSEPDIPGATDDSEVFLREKAGKTQKICTPTGKPVCTFNGYVTRPIVEESSLQVEYEIGKPEITKSGTHTVCITIPIYQLWYGKIYNEYYRWYNCCCKVLGVSFDCWVEVEFSHKDKESKRILIKKQPLKPFRRCDTDWGQWTIEELMELINKVLGGIGGAIGKAVGEGVGEPLKEKSEEAVRRALDQAKKETKNP